MISLLKMNKIMLWNKICTTFVKLKLMIMKNQTLIQGGGIVV